MPRRSRTYYSPAAREAGRLLGARIKLARGERRWTQAELAERVGVSRPTIARVERGDLEVTLGIAFEAAALLGVPLFDIDPDRRRLEGARVDDRLAVLPQSVRRRAKADDEF